MAVTKKSDKLKSYKITYFEGGKEKFAVILARSCVEAEREFKSIFRGCRLGKIEEVYS